MEYFIKSICFVSKLSLENQFSMCRHLYNRALSERRETYEKEGVTITYNHQQNQLPAFKQERPWYKSVHSQVLQDVLKRLDNSYRSFSRRVKEGTEAPGFTRFRKRRDWDSITYPQYNDGPAPVIRIPKIGAVKLSLHRQIPEEAKAKTLTITKDGGQWFASFSCACNCTIEPKQGLSSAIGIDLGLINLAYASDEGSVGAPKYYRRFQEKLARLQKKFSKAEKRGPKRHKLLKAVQKCHYRIKCQRHAFLHKEVNKLLDRSDLIIHEDLNLRGLMRRPKPKQDENGTYLPNGAGWKSGMNKSFADAGLGLFMNILKYKAVEKGKQVISGSAALHLSNVSGVR